MNIGATRNATMAIAIKSYFIQTQPSPVEGPHAQEVPRETFMTSAAANPHVAIEFDELYESLYLRFDIDRLDVV
jgi:hypothetical protein